MSKSECEAVDLFQKVFNDNYFYKYPYDWDGKKKQLVEVKDSVAIFIHRFHISVLFSSIAPVLMLSYVILYRHWFPEEMKISFIGEVLQYGCVVVLLEQLFFYCFLFTGYLEKYVLGFNRLLIYNKEISKLTCGSSLNEFTRIFIVNPFLQKSAFRLNTDKPSVQLFATDPFSNKLFISHCSYPLHHYPS
jgi:hypothetical protein